MPRDPRSGFRRSTVEAFHRRIVDGFADLLDEKATLFMPDRWWRRADKEVLRFYLFGSTSGRASNAERKLGGTTPVIALRTQSDWWRECRAWISWHEEWESIRAEKFELHGASLTLFWGPDQQKRQLIRAEWAEPPRHGGDAGQPHWHADFEEFVDFTNDPEASEVGIGAQQFGINLSKCHLAMAGWERAEVAENRWQARVGNDLTVLSAWALETLAYLAAQIKGCRRATMTL